MRLNIQVQHLLAALASVAGAVQPKSTNPILQNVLLKSGYSILTITATDLDRTVVRRVACHGFVNGSITVPHDLLTKLLKKFDPEDTVTIAHSEEDVHHVEVTCSGAKISLPTIAASEFPPVPEPSLLSSLSLPGEIVRQAIEQSAFCMSTDESRYVLNGLCLQIKKNQVRFIATDGRRLSMTTHHRWTSWVAREDSDAEGAVKRVDLILPAPTIHILKALLPEPKKDQPELPDVVVEIPEVTLTNPPAFAKLSVGDDLDVYTKLIEGNYPNVDQVVPQGYRKAIHLPVAELLPALQRARIIGETVSLKVDTSIGVAIEAKNNQGSTLIDRVGLADYEGPVDGATIAFDSDYIVEVASAVHTENVRLALEGDSQCGLFQGTDTREWLHVLMPKYVMGAGADAKEEPDEATTETSEAAETPAAESSAEATESQPEPSVTTATTA